MPGLPWLAWLASLLAWLLASLQAWLASLLASWLAWPGKTHERMCVCRALQHMSELSLEGFLQSSADKPCMTTMHVTTMRDQL